MLASAQVCAARPARATTGVESSSSSTRLNASRIFAPAALTHARCAKKDGYALLVPDRPNSKGGGGRDRELEFVLARIVPTRPSITITRCDRRVSRNSTHHQISGRHASGRSPVNVSPIVTGDVTAQRMECEVARRESVGGVALQVAQKSRPERVERRRARMNEQLHDSAVHDRATHDAQRVAAHGSRRTDRNHGTPARRDEERLLADGAVCERGQVEPAELGADGEFDRQRQNRDNSAVAATTEVASASAYAPPAGDYGTRDVKFYRERGMRAYRDGDLYLALANFDLAIDLDPGLPESYIDRGIVFHRLGDLKRAFSDVAEAKRIEAVNRNKTPSVARAP